MSSNRHLVIMIPGSGPEEERVRELSRIAEISPYDARLSLVASRPRLFRHIDGESAARRFSEALVSARIAHYVVPESDVLSIPVSRARRVELHSRHLEAVVHDASIAIGYEDLLLVVKGEIVRERHHDKRLGSKGSKGALKKLGSGYRLHLYHREPAMAIEIDPEQFDWSVLGDGRSASTLLNLERFVDLLEASAPQALVDRAFSFEPAVLTRAESDGDFGEVFAERSNHDAGVLYDNEAQFRFYTRWRFRLERHLSRARGERSSKNYTTT